MRKRVTPAQKAEAVALAAVVGAETAAAQLGWDPRSVRKWAGQAGTAPADAIARTDWATLGDAMLAGVAADLASGKLTAVQKATIAGIAKRNAEKAPPASESAVAARERFLEWVAQAYTESEDVDAWGDAVDYLMGSGLLVLANEEQDPNLPNSPHRSALLAWHSGREEIPAGDILEWAQGQTLALVKEHGSLVAWHRWDVEREDAERARWYAETQARAERSRLAWDARGKGYITDEQAEAWIRDGIDPLAEETAELIARAEAFLNA